MSNDALTLRPAGDGDMDFLLALYGTVREEELRQVPWTPEEKAAFVAQQFHAQHTHWHENYADTSWDLVLLAGTPIGRFYVARWAREIRIVDIALLPAHRGSGIGTWLLRRVLDEADAAGKKVSIHVEVYNPARRLYERLGFVQQREAGVYLFMERPGCGRDRAVR